MLLKTSYQLKEVVVGVKNHWPRTVSEEVARKPEKNKDV